MKTTKITQSLVCEVLTKNGPFGELRATKTLDTRLGITVVTSFATDGQTKTTTLTLQSTSISSLLTARVTGTKILT